jgi:hypothetical protein
MRLLLLLLLFTTTALYSQAQQTSALVNGEPDPSLLFTCFPMVLVICASIGALVYFLSRNNKRS